MKLRIIKTLKIKNAPYRYKDKHFSSRFFLTIFTFIAAIFITESTYAQQTYYPGDIAVINAIIDNNGLNWTKANPADGSYVPDDWMSVTWSGEENNKRVCVLSISYQSPYLTGTLDVSKLEKLRELYCANNLLTKLNVSGLSNLQVLFCDYNCLSELDLIGLGSLSRFFGRYQSTKLEMIRDESNYTASIMLNNPSNLSHGLSYADGVLTSNGILHTSSGFTVQTGLKGFELTGTFNFTYDNIPDKYYQGDIAIINSIIDNNGLNWTKANPADGSYVPDDWTGITWSIENNSMRVCILTAVIIFSELTGTLDVSELKSLQVLHCFNNQLTELNVSGLSNLHILSCYNNQLTELNVSELSSLKWFDCSNNQLTKLDLSGLSNLDSFYGNYQTVPLTLTGSGSSYSTNISLNNPSVLATGLSYASGKLTSNSNTITTSPFMVQTGLASYKLSGTLNLTYQLSASIDIPELTTNSGAYCLDGRLYVFSPVAETIQVYTTNGMLLYSFEKAAGTVNYPVNKLHGTVFIVRGSSGWVKKIIC